MKFQLHMVLVFTLLFTCCGSQENITIKQIEYLATTRGSSVQIIAHPDRIIYNDTIFEITPEKWNSLTSLIQEINLDNLKNSQAPSEDRYRDAALAAELKITTLEATYTSSQFDHGNPPIEIATLVEKINELVGLKIN